MTSTVDWRSQYPFSSKYLSLGAVRYHYVDEGKGRPVLFVHGNPTWSFFWRDYIRCLSPVCRAIAVDHIGCGFSDKPQTYDYSLARHIENLCQLIDQLALNDITLVGHDWGGAIGMGAALQRPDRFSRLIFFNTATFPPPFFPLRIRACRMPVVGSLAVRGLNLFARAAVHMAVEDRSSLTDEFRAGIGAPYNSWRNRIGIERFVRDIPTTKSHPTWQMLERIEQGCRRFADRPTCLVWGMRDWCFRPSCLDRMILLFPQAQIHRIMNAGHWVAEEAKDQVLPIIRTFLEPTTRLTSAGSLARL
jgi:haloalkane dehalogenase